MELSQQTQKLIQRYQAWQTSLEPVKQGTAVIHVDEVASKVAAFYEKVRGVIDWREEHLLRRASIERILKRRLFLGKMGEDQASPLVLELIRGGYFPNDKIEETKIQDIQRLLDKYIFILHDSKIIKGEKIKIQLYDWLMSLAACEAEEILEPNRRERALIEFMEGMMRERITAPVGMQDSEKNTQISIGVQQALFKLDKATISYQLLKEKYPDWLNLPPAQFEQVSQEIYSIWENIDKNLNNPLAGKFYQILEKYDTPYFILGDIISIDPLKAAENLSSPDGLESMIKEAYARRLHKLNSRIRKAAIFSTISIFLTKMLLAIAIEVPFDRYTSGHINLQALGLSVLIPPLLMFFIVSTIRPPKKSNLEKVIMETTKIIFTTEKKDNYKIFTPKKRGFVLNSIIMFFYLATFLASFSFIFWGLGKLNFGILSKIIFTVFFSLIFFAGAKIRERSKELVVEEERGGFLSFLFDSFSLPFLRLGKWLSGQWSKYNVVLVMITALIDMPFQLFTEFLEQWRYFVKEKKEEIR
ncbi:MAG: hypothetical protein Q7R46_00075 [bacterium]|nr:hypothetical protein [bacterium]